MQQEIVKPASSEVGRPLAVLVPLIKKAVTDGREAAERAAMQYYRAAGEMLLEAKKQMKHGEFRPWVKRHFDISDAQTSRWMGLVQSENAHARAFPSINEALRQGGHKGYMPNKPRPQLWHAPIKDVMSKVDVALLSIREDEMKRADERNAYRALGLQLIDIGFKALATKLHPDKGGSREAMARLNKLRKELQTFITNRS